LAIGFTAITLVDAGEGRANLVPANVDAALGALASLGVWLRRRWPVGFAVVVGVFSAYSVSASAVALIALFTVAVHRRARIAVLVAVGLGAASLLTLLVRPDLTKPGLPVTILGPICVAAVLAWGMFIRSRRQLAQVRREREVSEQKRRLSEARQLERQRIAREMHDVLGHRLSLLSLHAGALQLGPDAPPEEIARTAGIISETAHRALEDLREVILVLRAGRAEAEPGRGAPEAPQPSLTSLPALISDSRNAGIRIELECQVALDEVPDAAGRTAYRIVQEGLTNVRKHAPLANVSVSVRGAPADGLTIEIRNPCHRTGLDAPTVPGSGTGILGLAERVVLAGGRLEHGLTETGDFRLRAWLPWHA
jgi:signal transduction histidine kinase